MRPLTPLKVLLFGLALAATLGAALLPLFPRQLGVAEGDTASRTIRAPRAVVFESGVLTEQARDAAAQAVPAVQVFDPSVVEQQLRALGTATASVDQVRDSGALDDAAKRARLLDIENLTGLSRGSIDTIVALDDAAWGRVSDEAGRVLQDVTGQSIAADAAQSARDRLPQQVGADFSAEEAGLVVDLIRPLVVPTLLIDDAATQQSRVEASNNVDPVQQGLAQNQVIVESGQLIDAATIEMLEHVGLVTPRLAWDVLAATLVVAALAALLLSLYVWRFPTPKITSLRHLVLLALLVGVPVLVAKLYLSLVLPEEEQRFLAYVLPLAAAPMLVAALLEARLAVVVGLLQAALLSFAVIYLPDVSLASSIQPLDVGRVLLVYGMSALMGVYVAHRAERANQYVVGGVLVFGVALATLFAFWLLEPERRAIEVAWMTIAAFASGIGSGVITAGSLTAVGALLGVPTRIQLMELSQLNAPLLHRLQEEAPGTFHHSVIVGNLAERAASGIGADALLVRVGCYYHDIGKIAQPGYYIENQLAGDNPHDELDPEESAQIIGRHIAAGLELAQQHGLPPGVRAFIPEHHGTRLISYFYRVASQKDAKVDPEPFRYPGPRPQSRETAIVMLADSAEAMVRASPDRSPDHIDTMVEEVVAERLAEGELEECDLTLRDIRTIAESFKQTLHAVYHPRIAYPEATPQERRALITRFRPGRRSPGRSPEERMAGAVPPVPASGSVANGGAVPGNEPPLPPRGRRST